MAEADEKLHIAANEFEELATQSDISFENRLNTNVISDESFNSEEITDMLNLNTEKIAMRNNQNILDANHPLVSKYQEELKERLLKLLQETDEHLIDLKRTITAQEKENQQFAERGYELQKELKQQEKKLQKIHLDYEEEVNKKDSIQLKCSIVKRSFDSVDETLKKEIRRDEDFQKTLEDIAFEVVQLSSLQMETSSDAKTIQRAVEKTSKDREQFEIHKLRQDFLISHLENEKFNLEDKINFYNTQWSIKKEVAADLRKELISANAEMETMHFEKQQIVHQWKQSLMSLEKQDCVLAEIRESVRKFEDDTQILNMDIIAFKKLIRKELERNEQLILQQQFRESDIGHVKIELRDCMERENDLLESLSIMDKTIEITEQELKILLEDKNRKEKKREVCEKELHKAYAYQRSLEKKHMDLLHTKMTATKTSKYTEKLIEDTRNSIQMNEEKGSIKENEKEKLLLKLDNLKTLISNRDHTLNELHEERKERALLLDKSEDSALKARIKIDSKRNEVRELDNKLKEMIKKAGGQELTPFQRELANLKKEIVIAEQGKRNSEEKYLKCQQQLFSLTKESSIKSEENDLYRKKIAIMEGKKIQIEADITKEEKDIKDLMNRIQKIDREIALLNNLVNERKELQEALLQTTELYKSDFVKSLKESELSYMVKQNELRKKRRKKKKYFRKLIESQQHVVYWEEKVHLLEDTHKILKSDVYLCELYDLRSEIRHLQLKQEQIKKDQDKLVEEMKRAVYRHTSLYVEADKQILFGKRKKSPQYVKKRIKYSRKKVGELKTTLEECLEQIEILSMEESEVNDEFDDAQNLAADLTSKVESLQQDICKREQAKQEAVLTLSFKQKKSKLMQKVLDGTYIRAIRNEMARLEEIGKLQDGLQSVKTICMTTMKEYSCLEKTLYRIIDYVTVAKEI